MTRAKEVEIMKKLAKRNQNMERRAIMQNSFQAKQKVSNLNNELSKLEKGFYYTSEKDQATRERMVKQIKSQLARTIKDVVPILPPPIYK